MNEPRVGDPVTVLYPFSDGPITAKARVATELVRGFVFAEIEPGGENFSGKRPDHAEGATWIRGHHDAGSPEVTAMKAAFALR